MVAIVHVERDGGLVGLVVEVDALDAADDHAGALDGRLGLEAANVLELGLHLVATAATEAEQIAGLQGQEQQRGRAQQHEQADPDIDFGTLHGGCPWNAVRC